VGISFFITRHWGQVNRFNAEYIRAGELDAFDGLPAVLEVDQWRVLCAMPLAEIFASIRAQVPALLGDEATVEKGKIRSASDPVELPGVWPKPWIFNHGVPSGQKWRRVLEKQFIARWRAEHLGVAPPKDKIAEFRGNVASWGEEKLQRHLFRTTAEAMMRLHPNPAYRQPQGLEARSDLGHAFVVAADGRRRIGSRQLSLKTLVELYWDFATSLEQYAFMRDLFGDAEAGIAVKLDLFVEDLFGVGRYGRRRVTKFTRHDLEETARRWNIDKLLPLFAGDRAALAKLANSALFADVWERLSTVERAQMVAGLADLPLGQVGGGSHGGGGRPSVGNPAEVAQREALFVEFLNSRRHMLDHLGGADVHRLYETYRYLAHLGFEKDYDGSMRTLEYRMGKRIDPSGEIPVEEDRTLLMIYRRAYKYFLMKRNFRLAPGRLKPGTLRNVHQIGAQWLTEPVELPEHVSPDFALHRYVKFLLDEARLGKTRQMFAAWEKLRERGEMERGSAMLYVTRSAIMDEVESEVGLIYRDPDDAHYASLPEGDHQPPSVKKLRWKGVKERERVVADVADADIRIVHYQNFWRFNPIIREDELAKFEATLAFLEGEARVAQARGNAELLEKAEHEIERTRLLIGKLEARLPTLRKQWEALLKNVGIIIVDEAQEAENPSEEVYQAQSVRDAIEQVRDQREGNAHAKPPRVWWATASLYHSKFDNIRSLLEISFPDHKAFADPYLFRQMYTRDVDGMMQLHIDLGLIALRRRISEVYQLGDDIPELVEVPYSDMGEYTLNAEQIDMLRGMFRNFRRWVEQYNATAEPGRQMNLSKLNPLVLFGALEKVVQYHTLLGGVTPSPMIEDAVALTKNLQAQGKRVAIFCQFSGCVDALIRRFQQDGVQTRRFDGKVEGWAEGTFSYDERRLVPSPQGLRVRQATLNRNLFNYSDPNSVLVANIDSGEAGLALEADYIIFADVPKTWTKFYQAEHRHQLIGSSRKQVHVVSMVGTYPPQFLDGLHDPQEIAQFEVGSLGEIKWRYLLDSRVIWELIMNGEISPEGMRRLLERAFLASIPGLVDQAQTGRIRRRPQSDMPPYLMPELAVLWQLSKGRGLSLQESAKRQSLVAELSRGFQRTNVDPTRLVTVVSRLMGRKELLFDFSDLGRIVELLQAGDANMARDAFLRELPQALRRSAGRTRRLATLGGKVLELTGTPVAYLALPLIILGQLWQRARENGMAYVEELATALRGADRESVLTLGPRTFHAVATMSDLRSTLLPQFLSAHAEALWGEDGVGGLSLEDNVLLLEELALLRTINPAFYEELLTAAIDQDFATPQELRAFVALDRLEDWEHLLDNFGLTMPSDAMEREALMTRMQDFAQRWGTLSPIVNRNLLRLRQMAAKLRAEGHSVRAQHTRQWLHIYQELMRSELDGTFIERRLSATADTGWQSGSSITYLSSDRHHKSFWVPWAAPKTLRVPERIVGRGEMVQLLRREYIRLANPAEAQTLEIFSEMEGAWFADQWLNFIKQDHPEKRTQFEAAYEWDRKALGDLHSTLRTVRRRCEKGHDRTFTPTEDHISLMTRLGVEMPATQDVESLKLVETQILRKIEMLQRLLDWVRLSQTLYALYNDLPDASTTRALNNVRTLISDLEERLRKHELPTRFVRVVEQLLQLERQVRAISRLDESGKEGMVLKDLEVSKEMSLQFLHQLGQPDVGLIYRFRSDGSPVHLRELIDIAGSKNREFVVVRSAGKVLAVALATIEEEIMAASGIDGNAHIFLDWGWYREGYDFRQEMVALLADVASGMSYKLQKRTAKSPPIAVPPPLTTTRKAESSSRDVKLKSTGSYSGDTSVGTFSRLHREETTHKTRLTKK
jgi:hypothetical protein